MRSNTNPRSYSAVRRIWEAFVAVRAHHARQMLDMHSNRRG